MKLCAQYPQAIQGLKLRISSDVAQAGNTTSFAALRRAVEIAEKCSLPLSVHIPNYEGELKELIDILRPGDIFCHVFTPQKGILEEGKLSREIFRAREKGVILESACGKGHFGHQCAKTAIEAGLLPDIISGDFTQNTYCHKPAVSLPYLMSRFMALGMSFEEVLACVTTTPRKKLKMENSAGSLKTGAVANLTVLKRKQGEFAFTDVRDDTVTGKELLVPMATILEGDAVYLNHELY